jgi:hypothetical protein
MFWRMQAFYAQWEWEERLYLWLPLTFGGLSFHSLRIGHDVVMKDSFSLRVVFCVSDGADCSGAALELLIGYSVKWCTSQHNFN